jgi:hypothetical protein
MIGPLDKAIASVAPIDGVCLRTRNPPTVEIQFRPEATTAQRAAAQAIVDGWDWSAEAEAAREEANPEWTAVRRALAEIESDAAAWEAIKDTASAAQTRAAFTKLVGHVTKVARYVGKI